MNVEAKLDLRDNSAFLEGLADSPELFETLEPARRRPLRGAQADRRAARGGGPPRQGRAAHPHGPARRSRQRADRAVPHRPVVRQRQGARRDGDRRGEDRPHQVRAAELGEDLFRLDGEHPALVHLAPALVGPPDPGLVRAGRQGVRRRERGRGAGRRARLLRRQRRADPGRGRQDRRKRGPARHASSSATRTCSTPGSPPRCGRSRRSAGRRRRRR